MKHLTLNLLFFILTFCNTTNIALAQDCELPGPTDLQVVNITTNSVELTWTEVPGAMEYQVETVEAATGIPVSILNTTDNTIVVSGLQPDTEYTTEVTTICENSGHGGSSYVDFITDVIVVDIVMSLGCGPGQTSTSIHQINPAGTAYYIMSPGEIFLFKGATNTNPSKEFVLVFDMESHNSLRVSTTPDYPNLRIDAGGNGVDPSIIFTENGSTLPLATFQAYFPSYGNPAGIGISWLQEVSMLSSHCSTTTGGPTAPNNDDEDQGDTPIVTLSPNPTTGWFVVESTNETPMIITDLFGDVYYEGDLFANEPQEMDGSAWPNGTYVVQTTDEEGIPVHTLLIKTD
ncbi:MAG: fibronectin type III domain-containing protein [Bacteroidota bacterium]